MTEDNPFKVKEHKLTRRRVLEIATAAGFSSAVASLMTVDDVKAADSDEVTIPLDYGGNGKRTVPADWLRQTRRASDATDTIKNQHLSKKGVIGVATIPSKGGESPKVRVTLDKKNSESENRRGEIQERENETPVEIVEDSHVGGKDDCDPDSIPPGDPIHGGVQIVTSVGGCTVSSQAMEGAADSFGWSAAAHCANCQTGDSVTHSSRTIGEVDFVDVDRDWAYIVNTGPGPSANNCHPENHSDCEEIIGTLTEDGLATVTNERGNETDYVHMYGVGSCHSTATVSGFNYDLNRAGNCTTTFRDQVFFNDLERTGGDSGALYFTNDPNNPDNWYAIGSHSGLNARIVFPDEQHGPQGFSIKEQHGYQWLN